MNDHLRPCPDCARHVRVSDARCPFCQAALPSSFRTAGRPSLPAQRLGRAALFAFGVLGVPACDGDNDQIVNSHGTGGAGGKDGGGTGGTVSIPVYGAPAPPQGGGGGAGDGGGSTGGAGGSDAAAGDAGDGGDGSAGDGGGDASDARDASQTRDAAKPADGGPVPIPVYGAPAAPAPASPKR